MDNKNIKPKIRNSLAEIFRSRDDIFTDILGQETAKKQIKSALLMNRHIVIFGQPGIGKTTIAKNIAKLLPEITVNDCEFKCDPANPVCPACRSGKTKSQLIIKGEQRFVRIQGSPDLSAEDLIGDIDPIKAMEYGPLSIEAFTPGKIFKANNSVLFFDELNRCPEKLQNALLQVLEEGRATIGSYDVDIETNFIFVGTMNPVDINTERLSDVLLDRFDVVYMTYPETNQIEKDVMVSKGCNMVETPELIKEIIVGFIRELREEESLEKVPSVRATIGLYERAQANAYLNGNDVVSYPDLKDVVVSVLAHRIKLKPSVKYLKEPRELIEQEFDRFIQDKYPDIVNDEEQGGCR
ncbi:AAA family ATPase [Candidatus Woesearchaeota archaeon]|nr:AAA family ATPase [Candidatus Woesearchaeota archaeon]